MRYAHPRGMRKTGGAKDVEQWETLPQRLKSPDVEQSARTHGAFLRSRSDGIPDANTLLQLIMIYGVTAFSFRATAAVASSKRLAAVSSVDIRQRVARAGPWLRHLLSVELQERRAQMAQQLPLRVRIQDATVICLPGSKGTDYRVHLLCDLARNTVDVQLTDVRGGEELSRFDIGEGELVIGDRIYATRAGIAAVVAQGGHVLVRASWQNLPLQDEAGNRLNLVELARRCPTDAPLEVSVFTVAGTAPKLPAVKGRLVIARKTPEAAERARRKLRKESTKKGHTPSAQSLEAQDYVFLFTTVDAELLPAKVVLALYRWRWQIEICFKCQKSILGLGQVRVKRAALVEAVLCVKLLAILWLGGVQAHWQKEFLSDVPDPEAVMPPGWRMMQLLFEGLKLAIGAVISLEELSAAPLEVARLLTEPPRRRTRMRNAELANVGAHLGVCPLC